MNPNMSDRLVRLCATNSPGALERRPAVVFLERLVTACVSSAAFRVFPRGFNDKLHLAIEK